MELNAIEMPKDEAKAAFLSYRKAVKARHNREDEQIMRGYKALAQGKTVINLPEVIAAGGEDEGFRPRLAIVRADARTCWMKRQRDGSVAFSFENEFWKRRSPMTRVSLRPGTLSLRSAETSWWTVEAQAIVPNIPPSLRPAHALAGYHILFEAEWRPVAPKDPALLKHLGGDLWAVLAVWNLTELERAVIGARARR